VDPFYCSHPGILRVVVRDDFPNATRGYPSSVLVRPVFTPYSDEGADSVTCIQESYHGV